MKRPAGRGLAGLAVTVALMMLCPNAAPAAGDLLVLERTIRLDGVAGRIDHLAVDLARQRLFVAELGNGTVDVVDLATGKVDRRIGGLREPQGVAYLAAPDLILVASAGDGSLRFFNAADATPAGVIELGDDADNIRVDPVDGQAIVGYGAGGLAVIDAVARKRIADIRLPAHPEGFQLDPASRRIFVNLPDAQQIAVVDLAAARQVSSWRVPGAAANFPMALDEAGAVVAVAFRRPARLVLLDAGTGAIKADLATCGDADDVFFDGARRRFYVICGAGKVDVFAAAAGGYRRAASVDTSSGARTGLFVPALDRLFVAARASSFGAPAAILVFKPGP